MLRRVLQSTRLRRHLRRSIVGPEVPCRTRDCFASSCRCPTSKLRRRSTLVSSRRLGGGSPQAGTTSNAGEPSSRVSIHVQMATTGTPGPIPTTCILPLTTSNRRSCESAHTRARRLTKTSRPNPGANEAFIAVIRSATNSVLSMIEHYLQRGCCKECVRRRKAVGISECAREAHRRTHMRLLNCRPCLHGAEMLRRRFSCRKNELHVALQRSLRCAQLRGIRTREPGDLVDDPAALRKTGERRECLAALGREEAAFRVERPAGFQREIDRRSYAAVPWHGDRGNRHDSPFLHQRHRLGQVRLRADVLRQRHAGSGFLRCPRRHQDLPDLRGRHRRAVLGFRTALQTSDRTGHNR